MAQFMTSLSQLQGRNATAGERLVAKLLRTHLADDCLIWYNIPVGQKRLYPDFIVLSPQHGLLFLEVKDWKPAIFKKITKTDAEILTDTGLKTVSNPLAQARAYSFEMANYLQRDTHLQQRKGLHQGKLKLPYGHGVIFTNIWRSQIHQSLQPDVRELVLPDQQVLYKEDLAESVDTVQFQERLRDMFSSLSFRLSEPLSTEDINRIRWHLFPEVRIDFQAQTNLFDELEVEVLQVAGGQVTSEAKVLPDVMKVLDLKQEQLARGLGLGHRVIHGVAGSGKTLILGYRCEQLAQVLDKPILVLCFNITLAVKLKTMLAAKGLADKTEVHHFHGWCDAQLKKHGIAVKAGDDPYFDRLVQTMTDSVAQGFIDMNQYGAVMIDEGHDFEPDWLQAAVKMVDADNGHFLLLYDDAQSIYRSGGLNFPLSSVGIKAIGRTSILRLNYRNTREILQFAYQFASAYLPANEAANEDHIPLISPESGGISGIQPRFYQFSHKADETDKAVACIRSWYGKHLPLHRAAVLCLDQYQAKDIHQALNQAGIASQLLVDGASKKAYQPQDNSVAIMTLKSSKGLEFSHVVIVGVGKMALDDSRELGDAKLLYVGMTRAQQVLILIGAVNEADKLKGRGRFVKKLSQQIQTLAS